MYAQRYAEMPELSTGIEFWATRPASSEKPQNQVPNWYLDLTMIKYWGQERTYHHTAPIAASVWSVRRPRSMAAEEGHENRWARHRDTPLWSGLQDLGFHATFAGSPYHLIRVPEGVDEARVRSRL